MSEDNTTLAHLTAIYAAVAGLERLFPGRRFTPDGHMVGSIGEVLAAQRYDIELLPSNHKNHDARTQDGRLVQIRTTQGKTAPLKRTHDYLLVLRLNRDATIEEIFNGPGEIAWGLTANRKQDGNGQFNISLGIYRAASAAIPDSQRIPQRPNKARATTPSVADVVAHLAPGKEGLLVP